MRHDVSGMRVRLTDALTRERTAKGEWRDRTIVQLAQDLVRQQPDRILMIEGDTRLIVREVWDEALALAAALIAHGLKQGDVVAMQLPNWPETIVIYLAASMAGLILNPVLPILREREVQFMLRDSRARMLFVPGEFRNFDYITMAETLAVDLPDLENIVVLRGDAGRHVAWNTLMASGDLSTPLPMVDPNAVKILMYTSGTTGQPKGVMHTHNTLQAEVRSYVDFWRMTSRDVIFMASPVSHITGCLIAFELPWLIGAPVVLQEKWDAHAAIDLFIEHGVTFTSSSTPFLRELLDTAKAKGLHLERFTRFVCGGMTIPSQLIRDAHDWFPNAVVGRCFGMSELPSITLAISTRAQIDLGAETHGSIAPGVEGRVCDPDSGGLLAMGEEGEILARAPEQFVGYHRAGDNDGAVDEDGYFLTGDLGRLTIDNCLVITGRKKDLIIRGGENLSPKEIEDELLRHPAIAEVAVVAMPHPRLGEGVSCFVVPVAGLSVDIGDVSRFLIQAKIAKQKIPERVVMVPALPRNFQGKILKNELKEQMRRICEGADG